MSEYRKFTDYISYALNIVQFAFYKLDGNFLLGLPVLGVDNLSECSSTENLHELILLGGKLPLLANFTFDGVAVFLFHCD